MLTILSLTLYSRREAERERDRLRLAHPRQLVRLTRRKLTTRQRDVHDFTWGSRPRYAFTVRVHMR